LFKAFSETIWSDDPYFDGRQGILRTEKGSIPGGKKGNREKGTRRGSKGQSAVSRSESAIRKRLGNSAKVRLRKRNEKSRLNKEGEEKNQGIEKGLGKRNNRPLLEKGGGCLLTALKRGRRV